jgi:hypothetical protein
MLAQFATAFELGNPCKIEIHDRSERVFVGA